jgi:outer membrane protein OmpA-like peptidoglycan-associated protein
MHSVQTYILVQNLSIEKLSQENSMKKIIIIFTTITLIFTMIMGCAWSNRALGGVIGAGAGGAAGAVIGK